MPSSNVPALMSDFRLTESDLAVLRAEFLVHAYAELTRENDDKQQVIAEMIADLIVWSRA